MTALAGIMSQQEEQGQQPPKPKRRHKSHYLLTLANDADYERALSALDDNGGDGIIECRYKNGRLVNVDLKARFK